MEIPNDIKNHDIKNPFIYGLLTAGVMLCPTNEVDTVIPILQMG